MPKRFLNNLLASSIIFIITMPLVRAQESSWLKIQDNYYLSSIETLPWGLVMGENDGRVWNKPYNGLYSSNDLGKTWKEFGLKDKGITSVKYSKNNIYVTTYYHTDTFAGLFKTLDMGKTWEHIGPPYSANNIEVLEDALFLGTTSHGLYVSQDQGNTWEQKTPEVEIKFIKIKDEEIIAVGTYKTFKSTDKGYSWKETPTTDTNKVEIYKKFIYEAKTSDIFQNNTATNLNKTAQDLAVIQTETPHLYAIVQGEGLFKYEIPKTIIETQPLLRIPWEYLEENELIDKITAYFDHEYPLLGNSILIEPLESKTTTVNFLGLKEKQPNLYYSSHNGTDFALPYGTNIYATAAGSAKYFWCYDCGNSIEITHENGYKSIYMHVQDSIEISKTETTTVFEGQFIGKVGMTGKTTGPHLHLSIKKDNKVVDPYGWQDLENIDPWEVYNNNNVLGAKSTYIWKNLLHTINAFINGENFTEIKLDNKTIIFEKEIAKIGYSLYVKNYIQPYKQQGIKYIKNTSTLIEAIDLLGDLVSNIPMKVKLSFVLPTEILDKNVKIRYLNQNTNIWEPLETFIDKSTNSIYTYTTHFSQFAVFEENPQDFNIFTDKAIIKNIEVTITPNL